MISPLPTPPCPGNGWLAGTKNVCCCRDPCVLSRFRLELTKREENGEPRITAGLGHRRGTR